MFGYQEDWQAIPLADRRDYEWLLIVASNGHGTVVYGPFLTEETVKQGDEIYSDIIHTQRFLPRWIYPSQEHTMVCVDTQTDGNKFLAVYANTKQITGEVANRLTSVYQNNWTDHC